MKDYIFATLDDAEEYYFAHLAVNDDDEDGMLKWIETGVSNGSIYIEEHMK